MNSSTSREGPMTDSCKDNNESLGLIKGGKFLVQLSDHLHLRSFPKRYVFFKGLKTLGNVQSNNNDQQSTKYKNMPCLIVNNRMIYSSS
jgi:hypothetical protein